MTSVQQRYDSLQVARILGALLVATYHFGAVELQYGAERLISPLLTYAEIVIDLFFVVSGFLMGALYRRAPGGVRAVGEFMLRRGLRIYPSYWLITLGVLGVWMASEQRLFGNLVGPNPDILSSLLLIPSASRPIVQVAWTLLHEVYFYAGFALLLLVRPSWRPFGAALWAGGVAMGYVALKNPQAHPGLALIVSPYTLEFIAGVALGWCVPLMRRHAPRLALLAAGGLWVAGIVSTGFNPAGKAAMPEAVRIGLDGLTALLLCYGLVAADVLRLWSCPPRVVKAGDWSYALYLVHTVVIAGLCFIWRRVSIPGPLDNALVWALALALSLILSAQIFIRLERPASRSATAVMRAIGAAARILGARPQLAASKV